MRGGLARSLLSVWEANDCHEPAGSPRGGQFCGPTGGGATPPDWRLPPGASVSPEEELEIPQAPRVNGRGLLSSAVELMERGTVYKLGLRYPSGAAALEAALYASRRHSGDEVAYLVREDTIVAAVRGTTELISAEHLDWLGLLVPGNTFVHNHPQGFAALSASDILLGISTGVTMVATAPLDAPLRSSEWSFTPRESGTYSTRRPEYRTDARNRLEAGKLVHHTQMVVQRRLELSIGTHHPAALLAGDPRRRLTGEAFGALCNSLMDMMSRNPGVTKHGLLRRVGGQEGALMAGVSALVGAEEMERIRLDVASLPTNPRMELREAAAPLASGLIVDDRYMGPDHPPFPPEGPPRRRRRRTLEANNNCHEPSGTPAGGQFCGRGPAAGGGIVRAPSGMKVSRETVDAARTVRVEEYALKGPSQRIEDLAQALDHQIDGAAWAGVDGPGSNKSAAVRMMRMVASGLEKLARSTSSRTPWRDELRTRERVALSRSADGSVTGGINFSLDENHTRVEVHFLATMPGAPRGTGLRLLAQAARMAAEKGLPLGLESLPTAAPYYRRLGMTVRAGSLRFSYSRGQTKALAGFLSAELERIEEQAAGGDFDGNPPVPTAEDGAAVAAKWRALRRRHWGPAWLAGTRAKFAAAARALAEANNNCHEPAGSPSGGQFCGKGQAGGIPPGILSQNPRPAKLPDARQIRLDELDGEGLMAPEAGPQGHILVVGEPAWLGLKYPTHEAAVDAAHRACALSGRGPQFNELLYVVVGDQIATVTRGTSNSVPTTPTMEALRTAGVDQHPVGGQYRITLVHNHPEYTGALSGADMAVAEYWHAAIRSVFPGEASQGWEYKPGWGTGLSQVYRAFYMASASALSDLRPLLTLGLGSQSDAMIRKFLEHERQTHMRTLGSLAPKHGATLTPVGGGPAADNSVRDLLSADEWARYRRVVEAAVTPVSPRFEVMEASPGGGAPEIDDRVPRFPYRRRPRAAGRRGLLRSLSRALEADDCHNPAGSPVVREATGRWDESAHPRDADGKFAVKFGAPRSYPVGWGRMVRRLTSPNDGANPAASPGGRAAAKEALDVFNRVVMGAVETTLEFHETKGSSREEPVALLNYDSALSADPGRGADAKVATMRRLAHATGLSPDLTREIITGWATSSSCGRSAVMQQTIAKEFGLPLIPAHRLRELVKQGGDGAYMANVAGEMRLRRAEKLFFRNLEQFAARQVALRPPPRGFVLSSAVQNDQRLLRAARLVETARAGAPDPGGIPSRPTPAHIYIGNIVRMIDGRELSAEGLARDASSMAARAEAAHEAARFWGDEATRRRFVRAMYNITQDRLRAAGAPTALRLYRGIRNPRDTDLPLPHGGQVRVRSNPASSYSMAIREAGRYGRSSSTRSPAPNVLVANIPTHRILGLPGSGFGCLDEGEFVVLGDPQGYTIEHVVPESGVMETTVTTRTARIAARLLAILEENPYHEPAGGSNGGQFARRPGGAPIAARSVAHAARLLGEGEHVRLRSERQVSTLLSRLADMVHEATAKGEKAPNYDLCKVSVKGTNLFCAQSKGIPRIKMPQLKGKPTPGSRADRLPKDKNGEVDAGELFKDHLRSKGIKMTDETERADYLRASQSELVGAKVAGMVRNKNFDPLGERIMVSDEGYVVDGHHRWAAAIGRDAADGKLGDMLMPITRAHIDIITLLDEANRFAADVGIAPKAGS